MKYTLFDFLNPNLGVKGCNGLIDATQWQKSADEHFLTSSQVIKTMKMQVL